MNNPMIILIGLAIAAVGTLVAVNVVLPMLARAEAQAISAEVNTLAGAMWEAKRQRLDPAKPTQIKHMLAGWKCSAAHNGAVKDCDADTDHFNSSQLTGGFDMIDGTPDGFSVTFKAGARETCLSAAAFLCRMESPFFDVATVSDLGTLWTGDISAIDIGTLCDTANPIFYVALK